MAYTTINKSSVHFNTMLYTGDDGTRNITETGTFQADLVWLKKRNSASSHHLVDSVRGATKSLSSDASSAEATESSGVTGFVSDGFSLGGQSGYNNTGDTFASWTWKAGTSQTLNSGNVTSTVRANTTAGFSIVSWTGTAGNILVSHGLGAVPKMIIVKNRSITQEWAVYHASLGATKFLELNQTAAESSNSNRWNNSNPDATDFIVSSDGSVNGSGNSMIAYCFAEKQGYSKFGSYTGNGNTDGTFVYTGFKPAFIMVKGSNESNQDWAIFDNKRDPINKVTQRIQPSSSAAESGGQDIDFLSNGIKFRVTGDFINGSYNYIYMAFAEAPLVGSNGVTAKAR